MKAFRLTTRWIFIILMPVLLLSGTITWAFNSLWIYNAGFAKYDVSRDLGVSPAQLDRSATELIAYFNNPGEKHLDINVTYDNGDNSPLYDQADILHMKDVKSVIWLDYWLFAISGLYSIGYPNAEFGNRELQRMATSQHRKTINSAKYCSIASFHGLS